MLKVRDRAWMNGHWLWRKLPHLERIVRGVKLAQWYSILMDELSLLATMERQKADLAALLREPVPGAPYPMPTSRQVEATVIASRFMPRQMPYCSPREMH